MRRGDYAFALCVIIYVALWTCWVLSDYNIH